MGANHGGGAWGGLAPLKFYWGGLAMNPAPPQKNEVLAPPLLVK